MNPPRQPVMTYGTQSVHHFIDQLRNQQSTSMPAPAGLIYGEVGLGKTVAARSYLRQAKSTTPQLMLTVPPAPAPVELAGHIALNLREPRFARRARNDPVGTAVQLLKLEKVELIIFDDAENLTQKTLRFVADIRQSTHITVVMVASGQIAPKLLDNFHNLERLPFPVPTAVEVVEVLLPVLVPCGWHIDPTNPQHRQVGEYLWQQVRPSVRTFRLMLQMTCLREWSFNRANIDAMLRNQLWTL